MGKFRITSVIRGACITGIAALLCSTSSVSAVLLPGNILPNGDMEIGQVGQFQNFPKFWWGSMQFVDVDFPGSITGIEWDTAHSIVPGGRTLGSLDFGSPGPFFKSEWRTHAQLFPVGTTSMHYQWEAKWDVTGADLPANEFFTVNMRTSAPFNGPGNLAEPANEHKLSLTGNSNGIWDVTAAPGSNITSFTVTPFGVDGWVTMTADIAILPGEDSFDLIFLTEGNPSTQGTMFIDNLSAVPVISGDLNSDGFVGVDDLNIVLVNWNQNVTPGDLLLGDATGEGFVGVDDLNTVLVNWNSGTPPGDVATIPEPASLALFTMASLSVFVSRRSEASRGRSR